MQVPSVKLRKRGHSRNNNTRKNHSFPSIIQNCKNIAVTEEMSPPMRWVKTVYLVIKTDDT